MKKRWIVSCLALAGISVLPGMSLAEGGAREVPSAENVVLPEYSSQLDDGKSSLVTLLNQIASHFGEVGDGSSDINADGTVNVFDFVTAVKNNEQTQVSAAPSQVVQAKPGEKPKAEKSKIRKEDLLGSQKFPLVSPVGNSPVTPYGNVSGGLGKSTEEGGISVKATRTGGGYGNMVIESGFGAQYTKGNRFLKFEVHGEAAGVSKGTPIPEEKRANLFELTFRTSDFSSLDRLEAFLMVELKYDDAGNPITSTVTVDLDNLTATIDSEENDVQRSFDPHGLMQIGIEVGKKNGEFQDSGNPPRSQIVVENIRMVDAAQHKIEQSAVKKK